MREPDIVLVPALLYNCSESTSEHAERVLQDMIELLYGKPVKEEISAETKSIIADYGVPTLRIVHVFDEDAIDDGDVLYIKSIMRYADSLGAYVDLFEAKPEYAHEAICTGNDDDDDDGTDGIIVIGRCDSSLLDAIDSAKDVDCMSSRCLGSLYAGYGTFAPCTPSAVLRMMSYYGINPRGRDVCVVGRSSTVGRPLASMLVDRDATVTLCHSKTKDARKHMRRADVVVIATGEAKAYTSDDFRDDAIVFDVSTCIDENGMMCGSVDTSTFSEDSSVRITPVPKGIGQVTTAMLFRNVAEAHMLREISGRIGLDG